MIEIYVIETTFGNLTSYGDLLPFLSPDQLQKFNEIGYTGQGDREEYLNSLGIGEFKMRTLVTSRVDVSEKFIIVRVTPEGKDVSHHLQDIEEVFRHVDALNNH